MVLHGLGYDAIALQSDNDHLYKSIYTNLSERFKRLVIFFDCDRPGLESAIKLSEKYNLGMINIDSSNWDLYKVKDISDYIKVFGKDSASELMSSLLQA